MKGILYVLSVVLCILCIGRALGSESVLTLTESNFDETVNNAEISLVKFYAPWCGHCKHLAPEFEKAAQQLATNDPPVVLAKVDCTEEKSLGDRFEVRGYPTLYVFRNGKKSEYKGPRDAAGIVAYMQKQAAPILSTLRSADEVSTFQKTKGAAGAVVLGYFSDLNNKLYKTFSSIANTLREEFSFGLISDADTAKAHKYNNQIVVSKSDGTVKVYDPTEHGLDLESFINANSFSVGGEYTESNSKRYTGSGLPVLKLYIPIEQGRNQKRTQYYQRRLQKLVKDNPALESQIHLTVANKDTLLRDPSVYGLSSSPEFLAVIEKGSNKYVLPVSQTFNVDNLKKFVDDYLAGRLESYVKSQEVEPQKAGTHVVRVVGRNFEEVVEDSTKNVMIEFYAPWCGHCKTLEPIYEELAKKRAGKGDVVIAKLDATANDWNQEKYKVNGFPTIFFKTKSGKIETYNGERDVKSMDKWINARAE